MARPTTKDELLGAASQGYQSICQLLDGMSPEKQAAPFAYGETLPGKEAHWQRDKNLRDVLVHLYEWHQLLLRWAASNLEGVAAPFLPPPYNWRNYGEMNVGFWRKHQDTPLSQAKQLLEDSHTQAIELISGFSQEQLFTKKYYPWTGTTTLGSYCVSATSSHYDWALQKLKRHSKN